MSAQLLDLTVDDNPCNDPSFLGYKQEHGDLFWTVCAWCMTKRRVEKEAERLGIRVSHGLCNRCYAQQIARITGDQL